MAAVDAVRQEDPAAVGAAVAPPVLLARQPILDLAGRVRGHELLFRGPAGQPPASAQAEQATAHVLVAAFADLDLEELCGGVPAWINVTREFLLTFDPLPVAPGRVVVELLENAEVDDVLLERLARLRQEGHTLALDDFEPTPAVAPLVRLADVVKLDVRALGLDGFARAARALSTSGVHIVAEKVETVEERDVCARLGAELFQGWYFERPTTIHGRPVPGGPIGRLQAAVQLQGEASFEDIERVVTLDAGLAVRLLRYVNSASVGMRRRVGSVREALLVLGARTVRQWALLVLLSELGQGRPAVVAAGLLRARLCEGIARDAGAEDPDAFFAVGLLSVVDALLDAPLEEVVPTLPLTDELREALLERTGAKGEALLAALRVEHGEEAGPETLDLAAAVAWTERTLGDLD